MRLDLLINNRLPRKGRIGFSLLIMVALLVLSSCGGKQPEVTAQQADVDLALLENLPAENISYRDSVRPILERRCVVCHGCYDAPCQLKLSSPAGISRGANVEKVYNGARFGTMSPTRLYIDAKTTEQWRDKGFHTILNEGADTPRENLEQSVMYQMLRLKQFHPQPLAGMLPDQFDLSLDRAESCPTRETFSQYADKYPEQGMPFAMPNLKGNEYRTLVQWLAQGAPVAEPDPVEAQVSAQIAQWESFLNAGDDKRRLVARYLYEHLFLGHLHFKGSDDREFYRLVRSRTPSGQAVDEIATVRPYDDPGAEFYYRLARYPGDIVAKAHIVYELSEERMARFRSLFIEPDYQVTQYPSWDAQVAANPFEAFKEIPARSRYQFLLDDARYFIEGFIKGPVCRGMIALNVIEDNFWVAFLDPEHDPSLGRPAFLGEMSDYLRIPSELGDKITLLGTWKEYLAREREYVAKRFKGFEVMEQIDFDEAMEYLWDGNGDNPNAALTVFRHFDSASVDYGFVGNEPETAWVIDYPLFERIHYLLVAGFNVFGNLKHQLVTRLYMDFLRMEGEDMFLAFLPSSHRQAIHDSWYQGIRTGMEGVIGTPAWMSKDVVTGYQTDDPQSELYGRMQTRLAGPLQRGAVINRCSGPACSREGLLDDRAATDNAMRDLMQARGLTLAAFTDVAFVRVPGAGDGSPDLAYTIIRNKAYQNVTSMFKDEKDSLLRDYSEDTLTVVDWLEGSYPNFFFVVERDDVENFATRYASLETREDYERFVALYGIRRTNPQFWEVADWFQDEYLRQDPVAAGILDLNRYHNR